MSATTTQAPCPPLGTLQQHPTPAPPMQTPADDLADLLAAVLSYRLQALVDIGPGSTGELS